jgi:hypothetical protein
MKPILLIAMLVFSGLAFADEASDRAAIDKVVATLNDRAAAHAPLYTSDSGDSRQVIEQITDTRREPMSEVSPPFIVLNTVRFITPDVALVDATAAQYGSLFNRRTPVLLILRKTNDWQIAAARLVPASFTGFGNFMVPAGPTLVKLR